MDYLKLSKAGTCLKSDVAQNEKNPLRSFDVEMTPCMSHKQQAELHAKTFFLILFFLSSFPDCCKHFKSPIFLIHVLYMTAIRNCWKGACGFSP